MGEISTKNSDGPSIPLKDKSNPRALVNLLTPKFAPCLDNVSDEWLEMEFSDYKEKVQPKITPELRRLRVRFWEEYDRAQDIKKPMNISHILRGVCSYTRFQRIMNTPKLLGYLLHPVADYETGLKECLVSSVDQLAKFVNDPPTDKSGKISAKTAEAILRISQFIDVRLFGMATQRIESKNLNVNVNKTETILPDSMEEIQKELAELREKNSKLDKKEEIIDVDPE